MLSIDSIKLKNINYIISDTTARNELNNKVNKVDNKDLSTNDFTDYYKNKLDNIEENANKLIVDDNINGISINPVQNKIIYNALLNKSDISHIHFNASIEQDGFMSTEDKIKLINIEENANNYTLPVASNTYKMLY